MGTNSRYRLTNPIAAYEYVFGGNATVTLKSLKTGKHLTYQLRRPDDDYGRPGQRFFVNWLVGPNNNVDYCYLGVVDAGKVPHRKAELRLTRNSRLSGDSRPVRSFCWVLARLSVGEFPNTLEVWHEGRCGRCGRKLTTPESLARGFGPECAGVLGV
jgi:hypothetical protein